MGQEIADFRDLEAWKHCREIRQAMWELCREFPNDERFRLSDQIIRASRSSTACIAEGYGRFHYKENMQFCRQARGSLYELIDHITAAVDCGYVNREQAEVIIGDVTNAVKVLNGHIRFLKKQKEKALTNNN